MNYALTTPKAVVKTTSESDIQIVVRFATVNNLRVSVRGGGHSVFNSCDGIILDLAGWDEIVYDRDDDTVRFRPGALGGKVVKVAGERGRCVMSGTCNTVGMTSLYLGGGFGPLAPKLGMAIDSLLSARLITASGEILTVSPESNPEVFHILASAGQTLGVVTEMRIKTYPVNETLNTADETVFFTSLTFPTSRAVEITNLLSSAKWDENTAVYLMLVSPPEAGAPLFIFSVNYYGSDEDAKRVLKGLYDLKPIAEATKRVPYAQMNDNNNDSGERGEFKRMIGVGLKRMSVEGMEGMVEALENLLAVGDDLGKSYVLFELLGMDVARKSSVGVYPHRDIDIWCIPITWYSRPENHAVADKFGRDVCKALKGGDVSEDKVVYAAFRAGDEKPEELWGSKETAEKIGEMKAKLDPKGVFLKF
ncbi:FAD-binding domain-containing protein [Tuber magnatum]|uniref:FAD-binding domain-containing protein n=1 Tax=Tuber magnatum TaxID=42249 RepID=A0A317SR85_9PEZI|nr:FAD-binding domain-containing protein [Tuber magnatum]